MDTDIRVNPCLSVVNINIAWVAAYAGMTATGFTWR